MGNDFDLQETPQLDRLSREVLKYIAEYRAQDPFGRPPSQKELLNRLNEVLPKRSGGRPALVSTQQTHRLAAKLRRQGYLVPLTGSIRVGRNMVLTEKGQLLAQQLLAESRSG
jgi:hypothetical protein